MDDLGLKDGRWCYAWRNWTRQGDQRIKNEEPLELVTQLQEDARMYVRDLEVSDLWVFE